MAIISGLIAPGRSNSTVDVSDLDGMVAMAVAAGGTIALPKMPIPTMGWLAYCKDTEGNLFGMMQMDAKAA